MNQEEEFRALKKGRQAFFSIPAENHCSVSLEGTIKELNGNRLTVKGDLTLTTQRNVIPVKDGNIDLKDKKGEVKKLGGNYIILGGEFTFISNKGDISADSFNSIA